MPTTPACNDCTGLVSASLAREPHTGLLALSNDSRVAGSKAQFQCATCGYRWYLGPVGWLSVWD